MFTGIVNAIGRVSRRSSTGDGLELTIAAPYADLALGESIAVDGACLTVQGHTQGEFTAHIIRTSLGRSAAR